jgi:hypothetical protein
MSTARSAVAEAAVALQAETDLVSAIVNLVDRDHRWVAALVSRAFFSAARSAARSAGWSTRPSGALASLARYELALACGCPWRCELFRKTHVSLQDLDRMTALCATAARSGDVALLARLRADGCVWDAATAEAAAEGGHLTALQWARGAGCFWDRRTFNAAARRGDLAMLEWAVQAGSACYGRPTPFDAAAPASFNALGAAAEAAGAGQLAVLKWIRALGHPWTVSMFEAAAQGGHVAVFAWAHDISGPLCLYGDALVCEAAARGGHVAVLEWARRHGVKFPMRSTMCTAAAAKGHLGTLEWLRRHGSPWDADTCTVAMRGRHHDLARWAVSNGCPISRSIFDLPVGWLLDAPLSEADRATARDHMCEAAARDGDLPLLQRLRGLDYPWGKTMTEAARGGHLEIVQWVYAESMIVMHTDIICAAIHHHDVVEWVLSVVDAPVVPESFLKKRMPIPAETLQLLRNARAWVPGRG